MPSVPMPVGIPELQYRPVCEANFLRQCCGCGLVVSAHGSDISSSDKHDGEQIHCNMCEADLADNEYRKLPITKQPIPSHKSISLSSVATPP